MSEWLSEWVDRSTYLYSTKKIEIRDNVIMMIVMLRLKFSYLSL